MLPLAEKARCRCITPEFKLELVEPAKHGFRARGPAFDDELGRKPGVVALLRS